MASALRKLVAAGDEVAAVLEHLVELVPLVDDVLSRPSGAPCRLVVVTPRQAKHVRAEMVTVHYETGRCHHVGTLGRLEHEQTSWLPGQPSPNRLDTPAHLLTHLDGSSMSAQVSRPRPDERVPLRTAGSGARARVLGFDAVAGRRRAR